MPLTDKDARRIYAKLFRIAALDADGIDEETLKKEFESELPKTREELPRIAQDIGEPADDILQAITEAMTSDEYTLPPMIEERDEPEPVPGFELGKTTLGDPAGDIILPKDNNSDFITGADPTR